MENTIIAKARPTGKGRGRGGCFGCGAGPRGWSGSGGRNLENRPCCGIPRRLSAPQGTIAAERLQNEKRYFEARLATVTAQLEGSSRNPSGQ